MFDIDGMSGNIIEFRIDGRFDEANLFEFREIRRPDNYNIVYRLV